MGATQGTYTDRIELSWNTVNGTASYYVWRSTNPASSFVHIGTSQTAAYTDYAIAPGTFYYYKLTAFSGYLNASSDFSNRAKGICMSVAFYKIKPK